MGNKQELNRVSDYLDPGNLDSYPGSKIGVGIAHRTTNPVHGLRISGKTGEATRARWMPFIYHR